MTLARTAEQGTSAGAGSGSHAADTSAYRLGAWEAKPAAGLLRIWGCPYSRGTSTNSAFQQLQDSAARLARVPAAG